jgi:hypothetical protein
MLHEWLTPVSVAAFVRLFLHKQPYARPDAARCAVPILGWDTLERVLTDELSPDVLVVTRGKVIETSPPRGLNRTTRDWHSDAHADRSRVVRPLQRSARSCCAENHDSGDSPC